MRRLQINSKLRKNRTGFYNKVKTFQFKETVKWRGKPKEVHVIIPPVSPHDKMTKTGAAKVILSLLVMIGILIKADRTKQDGEPDINNLVLAPNAHKHFLVMVGDGLTQI